MRNRIIIFGVIALLGLIALFYWMGNRLGKSIPPGPAPVPGDGGAGTQSPSVDISVIRSIVDDIKQDIYSWGPRRSKPYTDLMALSDTDFVRAYNDWQDRYYKLDKETMRQAMEGELFAIFSITFQNIAEPLMNRFNRLNLK